MQILDEAVDWSIKAIFTNAGQVCLAGSRLYVQKDIYKEFLSRFHIKTEQMVVGDPMDQKTEIGPLSSEEHYKKVVGYLDLKEKEGNRRNRRVPKIPLGYEYSGFSRFPLQYSRPVNSRTE